MNEARNRFIKNLALSLKGNTLILFAYVEKHGKHLYEIIKEKHPNTYFVSGDIDAAEREKIRALVETENDLKIVASFGVFSTGTNMKRLNNMIFTHSTKSRIRTMQSLGRGLRLGEGKLDCTLFDIGDDISYKNKRNYTLNHMIERIKMYNAENILATFKEESPKIVVITNPIQIQRLVDPVQKTMSLAMMPWVPVVELMPLLYTLKKTDIAAMVEIPQTGFVIEEYHRIVNSLSTSGDSYLDMDTDEDDDEEPEVVITKGRVIN
jgi:superfamily II DNA or RNA helicase